MPFIKNYPELASSSGRKIVLNLIETGLSAVQFSNVMNNDFNVDDGSVTVQNKNYSLSDYERVLLIAFGKGSAAVAKIIERSLKDKLTKGFVIDVSEALFEKLEFTLGTHPLPSVQNLEFTKKVLEQTSGLTEKDLVIVVICGGGSVMFEAPFNIDLAKLIEVNQALLESGADIIEMNTIRKHLSQIKGGGLLKHLHPAKVVSLIFSDVPGNDFSTIASGPTVKDETTVAQALEIYKKYNLDKLGLNDSDFTETPKESDIFSKSENLLMVSNLTALNAMKLEAEKWGIKAEILTDQFKSDSEVAGIDLIKKVEAGSVLLVGGETTVKVKNSAGKGGRNQHLVLSALKSLDENTIIASVDSDGWDNAPAAGAIGDHETVHKAKRYELNINEYLDESNSFLFFNSTEDAIITDRLPSNVADLIVVYRR